MYLDQHIKKLEDNITSKPSHQKPQPSVSPPTASPQLTPSNSSTSFDRKFNVVVYGITECPGNTPKQTVLKQILHL